MQQKPFAALFLFLFALPMLGLFSQQLRGDRPMSAFWQNLGQTSSLKSEAMGLGMPMFRDGRGGGPVADMTVSSTTMIEPAMAPMPYYPGDDGAIDAEEERAVQRSATLSLLAEDARKLAKEAEALTTSLGGVVSHSSVYLIDDEGNVSADLTLRVPNSELDGFLEQLQATANQVASITVSGQDVTRQGNELEDRLSQLQSQRSEIQALLDDAETVDDRLSLQRELQNLDRQISNLENQMENLGGRVEYSSVSVHISTKQAALPYLSPSQPSLLDELRAAVRDSVRLYYQLSVAGMRLVVMTSPIWAFGLLAWILWPKQQRLG